MKKALKSLIALCMAFSLVFPSVSVFAANVIGGTNYGIATISEIPKESGNLNVQINLDFPAHSDPGLTLTLTAENRTHVYGPDEGTHTFIDNTLYYEFQNIPAGENYILTVSGNGYISYINHDIDIKANETEKLVLTNSHNINNDSKVGIATLGDLNGDHLVDDADITAMEEAIESNDYHKYQEYDLNKDGKLDISDLAYIVLNKGKENRDGTTLHLLNIEEAKAGTSETTTIANGGKLEDILYNNGEVVSLAPTEGTISQENPVEVSIDLGEQNKNTSEGFVIAPSSNPENNIKTGEITVTGVDENGEEVQYNLPIRSTDEASTINQNYQSVKVVDEDGVTSVRVKYMDAIVKEGKAYIDRDGSIVIDLKGKIAIKKVTIKVTSTESNTLADIASVEFLNGMEDKINPPTMNIPNITAEAGDEEFTVTWPNEANVTGYQVSISSTNKEGEPVTEVVDVSIPTITVTRFDGDDVENGKEYTVKVQSTNGTWKSGWSEAKKVTPQAKGAPEPPDDVILTSTHNSINVSWKKMKSTDTYDVYYRVKDSGEYKKANAEKLKVNTFNIENLIENTTYQVYVVGENKKGVSGPSIIREAKTTTITATIMPKYRLINTPGEAGELTANIKGVTLGVGAFGRMENSPLDGPTTSGDKVRSANGVVDNSFNSYYEVNDWDAGVTYHDEVARTPIIEFNEPHKMNYFAFSQVENQGYIREALVVYWDAKGNMNKVKAAQTVTKTDVNGRNYTVVKLTEPIETAKLAINIGRIYDDIYPRRITIAEMCFYEFDPIEGEIDNLFADQLHVVLKDSVTKEQINGLKARLDEVDEVSQELNPERENLLKELDTAMDLLENKANLKPAVVIDPTVTMAKDGHITFRGGLNAWQPLGVVGFEGESLIVYVGNPSKNIGDTTPLQLIATQYHAEASAWDKTVTTLKVGKNEVTIPNITSLGVEKGGSLYINYTGNNPSDTYSVRVSGGNHIPVLDLTKRDTEDEKKAAILAYVEELEAYVPTIPNLHETYHKVNDGKHDVVNRDYEERNCILGATEIVLDQIMYSVSAKQILAGLGEGTIQVKADKLYNSIKAMDEMIDLFYTFKGLTKATPVSTNDNSSAALKAKATAMQKSQYPSSRLNIRYQRMFAGAFMYAGGKHIGIEWPEVSILAGGNPIQTTTLGKYNGLYSSGNYFGWGIAHEIGHIINESAYVHAEVTNNVFSVLAQAQDTNDSVRFKYENVYDKVTSGTVGKASNVFTQLGLYWQLHLAYDKGGYNFARFNSTDVNSYDTQMKNLFFARVDTYARATSVAPQPDGIALTLGSDRDNNLMRLSVAAAEKDILEFFERWGMVPDETTREYASQFEKEERAIYYINDDARRYELSGGAQMPKNTEVKASITDTDNNKVTISLGNSSNIDYEGALLGYEVLRSYQERGTVVKRAVAFVTSGDSYTDTIDSINNRVFTYSVVAYDKYLNKTAELVLDPIKIKHDGSISKAGWTIESNFKSANDKVESTFDPMNSDSCESSIEMAITKLTGDEPYNFVGTYDKEYDKKLFGIYEQEKDTTISDKYVASNSDKLLANANPNGDGIILITLAEKIGLVALKYTAGTGKQIKDFEIQVSTDKVNWDTVKTGTFKTLNANESETIYFDKPGTDKLFIYDATYVRLVVKNQKEVSIAGIDLLAQTGDNIEIEAKNIGILQEAYQYADGGDEHTIPAGSLIFQGTYTGDPAYNVVILWDEDNNIIDGEQIILADHPGNGNLGVVKDGIWIYWIKPADAPESVRAELYRVDDAQTLKNERVVSDALRVTLPAQLPNVTIQK